MTVIPDLHNEAGNTEDEVAIGFCVSTKCMASGLPIANIISDPAPFLPLLLSHQAPRMVCAALAQRYGQRANYTVFIADVRS